MRPDPMPPLAAARVESKLALLACLANLVGELEKSVLRWLVRA